MNTYVHELQDRLVVFCTILLNIVQLYIIKNNTSDGTMTTVYVIDKSSSRGSTDFTVSYPTTKTSSCLCVEV